MRQRRRRPSPQGPGCETSRTEPQESESTIGEEPKPPKKTRPRLRRLFVRIGAVLLAVIAGVLVSVLTVDLGPTLKARAEAEGSKFLQRPMRLGRLSSRLIPGVFVIENLVIEGLTPQDRPFLTAKKITVWIPWWSIFTRKFV